MSRLTRRKLAMRILREFYVRFNRCPAEGYDEENLMNLHTQGWTKDDLETGLNYCLEKGWLAKNNDLWLLTEEGSAVAE